MSTAARVLLVAAILTVAALGLCQADAHHTGLTDPCVALVAIVAVGSAWAFSLPLAGYSLPAPAHAHNLYAPDLTAPPPEA